MSARTVRPSVSRLASGSGERAEGSVGARRRDRGADRRVPGADGVVELPGARLFLADERAGEFVQHLRRHWAAQDTGLKFPARRS
jgi:hypothetical protein